MLFMTAAHHASAALMPAPLQSSIGFQPVEILCEMVHRKEPEEAYE